MTPGKYIRTPESNEKNRQSNLGKKRTKEVKTKIHYANLKRYEDPLEHEKSKQASLKLFKDPLEIEKLSKSQQKSYQENPERKEKLSKTLKIIKNTPESIKINSDAQLIAQNKPETIEKQRQVQIIVQNKPEIKAKIKKSNTGKIRTLKAKENYRKSAIKRIEQNYGICYPSYNLKACEYFELFDAKYNTKGHYAMYGGGEYHIKELGYFPDYINFDLKLIMEWDEKRHYYNGKLKHKDEIRQKEIQEHFPDFEFFRIRE